MLTVNGWVALGAALLVGATIIVLLVFCWFGRRKTKFEKRMTLPSHNVVGYQVKLSETRRTNGNNIVTKTRKVMGVSVKDSDILKALRSLLKQK